RATCSLAAQQKLDDRRRQGIESGAFAGALKVPAMLIFLPLAINLDAGDQQANRALRGSEQRLNRIINRQFSPSFIFSGQPDPERLSLKIKRFVRTETTNHEGDDIPRLANIHAQT